MGAATVPRPDCDLCALDGRCDEQGGYCRELLFAVANDRAVPDCKAFVESPRRAIGYGPRTPLRRASKKRMIRRLW